MKQKTEWAKLLGSETQYYRGIYNYIYDTFEGAKGTSFSSDELKITSKIDFLNAIMKTCKQMKIDYTNEMEDVILDIEEQKNTAY